ncbi:CYB5R4, partial [Symbiodinium microadriaticum]
APLRAISREELKQHNTQYDCWTALNGKVYNITQYLAYHPGGEPKLMLGAGKDCTALFNKYHPWVAGDSMLSKCQVGVLSEQSDVIVEEDEEEGGSELAEDLKASALDSLSGAADDDAKT